MANNVIQHKRTSTAGRQPNTTVSTNSQYIGAGEFALNMADQVLYTSDGTNLITVGSNVANQRVGNLTISAITANGSLGSSGQALTTNGSNVYWSTIGGGALPVRQKFVANGSQNTFTVTGGYYANNLDIYLNGVKLLNNTEANTLSGSTFTILTGNPANGTNIEIVGTSSLTTTGVSTIVNQQITANGTANSFAITNGYIANSIAVFLNGVKQIPGTDVITTSGANIGFAVTPANNYVIDVYGYQTAVSYTSNVISTGNVSIGVNSIIVGNSTVNTTITANGVVALAAGSVSISNTLVVSGTSTYTGAATFSNTVTFSSDIVPATSYKRNRIINGNMLIDQRNAGASVTVVGGGSFYYACDRFFLQSFGASSTAQRTAGSGSSQYQLQFNGASGVTSQVVTQRIESTNCFDLASQTATLSFSTSNSLLTTLNYAVFVPTGGTDTWTSQSTVLSGSITINSTMTRYAIQLALPSSVQSGMAVALSVGSQISGTWVLQNIQLEVGTVATPYERQIYSDQLAQCQRYYFNQGQQLYNSFYALGSTGYTQLGRTYPVTMRATPTITLLNTAYSAWSLSAVVVSLNDFALSGVASGGNGYIAYNFTASSEL